MLDSCKHIKIPSNTKLLDLDDDTLGLIFEKCSLRELIILMKTCRILRIIILNLPVYKNGIKELKDIYVTDILKITNNIDFILAIANKNYSNIVLDAINFRFFSITRFDFWGDEHRITNKILIFISRWCKNLDYLNFVPSSRVTDISCLNQCDELNYLHLSLIGCTGVTDVSCLGKCKKLERLCLWHYYGVMNLSYLCKLKMLTILNLSGCTGLTDIYGIGQCEMLTEFSIAECSNVKDISELNQCKNLRYISLWGCTGVKDVSCLAECKMLTELNLCGCTNLIQENVDSLMKELPNCRIDY